MTCALNGSRNAALVFQAVACDTAWEQLALFVDELKEEICVLVINVFDSKFAETAVLFAAQPEFRVAEELDIFSRSSHSMERMSGW